MKFDPTPNKKLSALDVKKMEILEENGFSFLGFYAGEIGTTSVFRDYKQFTFIYSKSAIIKGKNKILTFGRVTYIGDHEETFLLKIGNNSKTKSYSIIRITFYLQKANLKMFTALIESFALLKFPEADKIFSHVEGKQM